MSEETPYREGNAANEPDAAQEEQPQPEGKAKPKGEPTPGEWFTQEDMPDEPHGEVDPEKATASDIVTAVLLVRYKNGAVLPIMNLEDVDVHHRATPHEVFRMCADVQDQISTLRVIGELGQLQKQFFQRAEQRILSGTAQIIQKSKGE